MGPTLWWGRGWRPFPHILARRIWSFNVKGAGITKRVPPNWGALRPLGRRSMPGDKHPSPRELPCRIRSLMVKRYERTYPPEKLALRVLSFKVTQSPVASNPPRSSGAFPPIRIPHVFLPPPYFRHAFYLSFPSPLLLSTPALSPFSLPPLLNLGTWIQPPEKFS